MPGVRDTRKITLSRQPDFSCRTHGKCIVAGEHAVLRGAPALVVPVKSRYLDVSYTEPDKSGVWLDINGLGIQPHMLNLEKFLKYACACTGARESDLEGVFSLDFQIPLASGLGASACISVAFARWFLWRGLIGNEQLFSTAHAFENFFHGSSSGVDVAAVIHGKPLLYQNGKVQEVLEPSWMPMLYLSATGKASSTAEAISKAVEFNKRLPCQGESLDIQMANSVKMVKSSLLGLPHAGFRLLKDAIEVAHECFHQWGLAQHARVRGHFEALKAMGASAVKLTGAGDGGYMLSLWEFPPVNPPFEMIRVS